MQQLQRTQKSEKKWYFLAKMIKICPEGTQFLFTILFSLLTKGLLQHFATAPMEITPPERATRPGLPG